MFSPNIRFEYRMDVKDNKDDSEEGEKEKRTLSKWGYGP